MPILFALPLILAFPQDPAPPADLDRERARHQGVWAVESYVYDGRPTTPELARSITRTVEGDHVVWKRDGKSFAGTTVALDPAASPHAIDVIPDGGKARGERVLGIYKFDGESLVICMAGPGKPRPRGFEAEKGTGQTLMTLRRAGVKTP